MFAGKIATAFFITAILAFGLTACSFSKEFFQNIDYNLSLFYQSYDKLKTNEEIIEVLKITMQKNESVCYFNVQNEEMINADYWIASLPGIEEVRCDYTKVIDGYNVAVNFTYWDNYPVIHAFQTGNNQYLNDEQLTLYNKYCEILNTFTSPSRSQFENELAIHNYIVDNIEYTANMPTGYNAYDALINGISICSGYTEVFKTFMDMLGIECITIDGTANNEPHIWNLVNLESEWYHVDVTWDDPVNGNGITRHTYFNVTDTSISADHIWDKTMFPSATGEKYSVQMSQAVLSSLTP